MAIPEKIRRHGKGLTNKITLYLDDRTVEKLSKGFETFRIEHHTFSSYLRSVITEYVNSPFFQRYVG